jgi:hypothetical protein
MSRWKKIIEAGTFDREHTFKEQMLKRILHIVIASVLVLVLAIFNVGIPIKTYLCPMMDMDDASCEMMPQADDGGLSYSAPLPDCCVGHIVAEGNTTPYISVEQFKTAHLVPLDQPAVLPGTLASAFTQPSFTETACNSPSPPFRANVSLSILNSTFLI